MNKNKIKSLAGNLEDILRECAINDEEAKNLLSSLDSLLEYAKLELINKPVEHVPGRYWFNEGALWKYEDLESAYAKFCISITMSDEELVEYEKFKAKFESSKS